MKRVFIYSIAVIILLLAAVSCSVKRPLVTEPAHNNQTYNVSYLFEHDGCKVYRFWDDGQYVYFTNCTGSTSTAQSDSTNVQVQTTTYRK